MPTLVLRFPGGRYHATPGGHHVNEGLVEWPPSPWRLVRALVATGYATHRWIAVPPEGRRLIEALSSVLPEYRLPPAALGHSRHYMPTGAVEKFRARTTLVLDTFADVADGALWVRWPVSLDAGAQALFGTLVAQLGYLGRSESWVIGRELPDDSPLPDMGRAFPHVQGTGPLRGFEQVSVTAPAEPAAYASWREAEVRRAFEDVSSSGSKKRTKKQQRDADAVVEKYPVDLIDCLERDTAWWRGRQWSHAPGARVVLYWREARALEVAPPATARPASAGRFDAMLLALSTPSGSKSALPRTTRTLPQADLLHKALVSKLGFQGEPCPELSGRDQNGAPLKGHAHAHVLPLDLDADGHLDHVLIHAPMGLGSAAQRAIRALRKTYMKGGVGELQVAVAAVCSLADLRAVGGELGGAIDGLLGPIGGAKAWVSATPFVPPRHLKGRGRSCLAGQVEEEIESRGLPRASVELLPWTAETLPLRHFVRRRQRGPQPLVDVGFPLRLEFERPVAGPICLGYGSHFGMGRFSLA
ncbi:MAG: type I-U CRISPR-associated protein Cas5/Cas6 [Candidatus Eisenbacteria bacterium]|nr:type I-U CRISPR-associated protein Cas5/Cas6 [Candidatus Eisenbacteria bacterium]